MLEFDIPLEQSKLPIREQVAPPTVNLTNKTLTKAIDIAFFGNDPGATEKEKMARRTEFIVAKYGIVQFSDVVSYTTRRIQNIVPKIQDIYDELILTARE